MLILVIGQEFAIVVLKMRSVEPQSVFECEDRKKELQFNPTHFSYN